MRDNGKEVAIKFAKNTDKTNPAVEAKLLRVIADNDPDESNLVKMIDNFSFRDHYVIVFELLNTNLYNYYKAKRRVQNDELK